MADGFKPILYLKDGCPFCFKLRVFLLDAGLLEGFTLREFSEGTDAQKTIREELSPHFDKVSFPSAQISPGIYQKDSDGLIAHFAEETGADLATLDTYQAYVEGPFARIMSLFKENKALKQQAA